MFKFLLILLTLQATLSADVIQDMYLHNAPFSGQEKQPLFISIGSTCHVAIALKALGLRDAAYPFDWIITTRLPVLASILDDDFKHYTDPLHFIQRMGAPAKINTYYSLDFPHDFKTEAQLSSTEEAWQDWNSFKERYDRRIERFQSLRHHTGKVFFVRSMWGSIQEVVNGEFLENQARAQLLVDTLKRYFPDLDFTLLIISHPDLNIPPLEEIPQVVELKIDRSHEQLHQALMALAYSPSTTSNLQPEIATGTEPGAIAETIALASLIERTHFTARLASSPFTGLFVHAKDGALHLTITFKPAEKSITQRLQDLGLKNKKSRKKGSFETRDLEEQQVLLNLALEELLITLDDYKKLLSLILNHRLREASLY